MADLISWTDDYSVGVASIDKQHKILINIINELNDILVSGQSEEEIDKVFDALKIYVQKHFAHEEAIMEKYHYPASPEHHHEHQELLNNVLKYEERMKNGNFMIAIELMEFLKNWLSHHVFEIDMALGQFIQDNG